MATWNYELQHLTLDEIEACSERFLMGWHDPIADGHKFRIKGLNARRKKFGLEPLTKEWSVQYRVDYVTSHYSQEEIIETLKDYLLNNLVADTRWTGIELFDCRFGRDYVKVFKQIVGSKVWRQISEETRKIKLMNTQMDKYGGVGVAGIDAYHKMIETKSMIVSAKMKKDVIDTNVFGSKAEEIVWSLLVDKFGRENVFYQYGVHPADSRYPYPCDFYVKPLDLFIELHVHYSHCDHWYDDTDKNDKMRVEQILRTCKEKTIKGLKVWTEIDIKKRDKAKESKINYLVFWDGKHLHADKKGCKKRYYVPRLKDFYKWYYDYDCNYELFIKDFPENTY